MRAETSVTTLVTHSGGVAKGAVSASPGPQVSLRHELFR